MLSKDEIKISDLMVSVLKIIDTLSSQSELGMARTSNIIKKLGKDSGTVRTKLYLLRLTGFIENSAYAHWRLTEKGREKIKTTTE